MPEDARDEPVDARVLPVRADVLLHVPPQMIHRVQVRGSRRQPEQGDAQRPRKALRGARRMARVSVQQQRDVAVAIAAAQLVQERAEVRCPLPLAAQQHEVTSTKVHRAEQHTTGIAAGQPDLGLCSTWRPAKAQRRKEQQVGFVLGEKDASFR